MRTIKGIFPGIREDIGDLVTRRSIPTEHVDLIDPFLFLNHHGPQTYRPNNRGLPFSPHPHRGFETVTFILEGDLEHRDSGGHSSVIRAGGVQWMTAGRGLVHSELSSDAFKKQGGPLEILQLWLNLPAKFKMTDPRYVGLQVTDIPHFSPSDGVQVNLISGAWDTHKGPVDALTDVVMTTVTIKKNSAFRLKVAKGRNIFFYIIRGEVNVADKSIGAFNLVEFNDDGTEIEGTALSDATLIFAHATPYNEPVVSYGPFVMNTTDEIKKAIEDYRAGKF